MTPYGAPLHPILVHFPIVLLITTVVFGFVACLPRLHRLRILELAFLVVGLVATVLTRQTGEQNADTFRKAIDQSPAAQQTFEQHDTLSKWVLIVFGLLLMLRLAIWAWQVWNSRQKILALQAKPVQLFWAVLEKAELVPVLVMVLYLLGAIAGLVLLALTGYYGGELVFTYEVGPQIKG